MAVKTFRIECKCGGRMDVTSEPAAEPLSCHKCGGLFAPAGAAYGSDRRDRTCTSCYRDIPARKVFVTLGSGAQHPTCVSGTTTKQVRLTGSSAPQRSRKSPWTTTGGLPTLGRGRR